MKRALIVTTVSGFVPQFELNHIKILQEMGYEVHYASNFHTIVYGEDNTRLDGTGIIRHQIDFVRSPYCLVRNVKCFLQLRGLISRLQFDIIHCHTPMGGVLARIAAESVRRERIRNKKKAGTAVLYTAHGFHFYRGAPLKNWLFYYPVEIWLARYTDVLITINREDYRRGRKFKMRAGGRVTRIDGIGIDVGRLAQENGGQENREILSKYCGTHTDKKYFISVGELTRRKNHRTVIEAAAKWKEKYLNSGREMPFFCLICGSGNQEDDLKKRIRDKGLEKDVFLTGYVKEIPKLLNGALAFLFPSRQEGLPVAVMEAMAAGLPILCSDIRGNSDLIRNQKGGYLIKGNNPEEYAEKMEELLKREDLRKKMGEWNRKKAASYGKGQVGKKMKQIYQWAGARCG